MMFRNRLKAVWHSVVLSRSLRSQVVFGLLVIIVSIIFVISYLAYAQSTKAITRNLKSYVDQVLLQLDEKFTMSLMHVDRLTVGIILNPEVKQALEEEKRGKPVDFERKLRINNILFTGTYSADQPVSLRLFGLNGGIYDNVHSSFVPYRSIEEMKRQPWFEKVVEADGRTIWLGSDTPAWEGATSSESAIIGIRRVNSEHDGELIGFLLISLHRWAVSQNIDNISWGDRGMIYLLDERDRLIFSTESNHNTTPLHEWINHATIDTKGSDTVSIKNETFWVAFRQSKYTDWKYVSLIPLTQINGDLLSVQRSIFWIGMYAVFAAVLYSIFLSFMISQPIRQLVKGMRRVEQGDFTTQLSMSGNQEVMILSNAFNRMVDKLKDLLYRLAEQQVREKEARLQAINSQFRPHFLYNTLNTIYWKCIKNGQEEIGHMVITLSKIMRYSIQPGIDLVTVKNDFEQLEHYLYLQKERYGDDLHVEIELDSRIEQFFIPKLLLQPTIENAMVHGLEPSLEQKRLVLSGKFAENHMLEFSVEDNGVGMTPEQRKQLLTSDSVVSSEGTGIGLNNLRRRLMAHFGTNYSVKISSDPGKGTKVTICMPIVK